ncbi:hypothetical protein [Acidithiobacillus thiooxidans]|jgi:hypothetical protein|uniref:hypothetical protein n=1 Tax=Acidithiobacillus thiooxidans TaxID=930 RepID=UPI0004E1C11D|nr:hypothetical protein [Acidithiobacillus thiooxidans]
MKVNKLQQIKNQAIANMTHSDMGLLIDIVEYYLPGILKLDVQVRTSQKCGFTRTVLWVEGPEYPKAAQILEKMACAVRQRDPYGIITENGARAMFGLPPAKTISLSAGQNFAGAIRRFLWG